MDKPLKRCDWCINSELYMKYHDEEWGTPVHNDLIHFEFLVLESAQAGLSWLTIGKTIKGKWKTISEIPAKTELSDRIAADMKKRGFKFLGSTIMYAHLQATGIVNDHITSCFRNKTVSIKS